MALRKNPADFGLRVRNDGSEDRANRAGMFQPNYGIPVADRNYMSNSEYMHYAGPAVAEARRREDAICKSIDVFGKDGHGGEYVAGIVFNQGDGGKGCDDYGIGRARAQPNPDRPDRRDFKSQVVMDDFAAAKLVDGRGDGMGPMRPLKGEVGGPMRGGPQHRGLVPTSGVLNANPNAYWVVDRDQRLDYATDPAKLQQAAQMGAENAKVAAQNRAYMRGSSVMMGEYDLNPGGHKLNNDQARADDYGIGRLRSDKVFQRQDGQMASLLAQPDSFAPLPAPSPGRNPYAGRSNQSTVFDGPQEDQRVQALRNRPQAGRRSASTVLDNESGPAPPVPPPGSYLGHRPNGDQRVAYNPHAGRTSASTVMADALEFDPESKAADANARHDRRRQNVPLGARRVPLVEDIVFNHEGPLANHEHTTYSQPTAMPNDAYGKKAVGGRAARTNVGARELGGNATAAEPNPPPPQRSNASGYHDDESMLHYTEYADADHRYDARLPPRGPSEMDEAMAQADVPADAYSPEPRGLPKRHPGPERLRRGRGVDGAGHDHHGRQLATSLVDEVVFGRSNFQGKLPLGNNGVNFGINQAGDFAHR